MRTAGRAGGRGRSVGRWVLRTHLTSRSFLVEDGGGGAAFITSSAASAAAQARANQRMSQLSPGPSTVAAAPPPSSKVHILDGRVCVLACAEGVEENVS